MVDSEIEGYKSGEIICTLLTSRIVYIHNSFQILACLILQHVMFMLIFSQCCNRELKCFLWLKVDYNFRHLVRFGFEQLNIYII